MVPRRSVPPARDGRIAAEDVASLTAFGTAVRTTYGTDLRKAGPGPWTARGRTCLTPVRLHRSRSAGLR
ncbi:hypothetical protein ACWGQL_06250 [Streptomyces lydicus]